LISTHLGGSVQPTSWFPAVSPKIAFTVTYSHDYTGETSKDAFLEYKLSKVIVKVGDHYGGGHGYYVRVFNKDAGQWGEQWGDNNGLSTWWLIEGNYEYRVERDCYNSGKVSFTVAYSNDYTLVQKATATVTIKVIDNTNTGRSGYLVRVYKTGGSELANQWSNGGGLTTFQLDALGSYQYVVERNGAQSAKKPITAKLCGATSTEYKLAKVTVTTADNNGTGYSGYLVRIYNDGAGEWGNAWTNGGGAGLTTFYLIEGKYEYLVEKNGAKSARYDFSVAAPSPNANDQNLAYELAKVTVKAADNLGNGYSGYLVRIYNDGAGEWGNAWTNGGGLATFYLIEGKYEYLVEKNGATSQKYDFTVEPPSSADDQDLVYLLAKVTVKASDTDGTGHSGYLVRIYNDGASEWGNAWTNGGGLATFYLIEGKYEYLVEKNGATSDKIDFTVDPPNAADDQDLEYKLATVTVKAGDTADSGHSGYLVRIYNDGAGEWGNAWTNGGGVATFYLIEGKYEYLLEKNGAKSARIDFTVADTNHAVPVSGNPDDQDLKYKLAKVTVHVQKNNSPLAGYLVRIYNNGASTSEWGNAWTNGSGDAAFYLIEGGYQYQVEKNVYNSGKLPTSGFTVAAPPPANDQTYIHIVL